MPAEIPTPALRRFLAALHRRAVLVRLAERVALAILAAAAVAIIVTLILWWQDRSALTPTAAVLLAGAAIGMAWGIVRRPSRLDAAVTADRQLQLDDLLGTAAVLNQLPAPAAADSWSTTVLALADTACRTRSASAVVLRRLDVRVWGGVVLSVILAITLALIVSPADESTGTPAAPNSIASSAGRSRSSINRPLIAIASDSPLHARAGNDPEEPAGPAGQSNPDRIAPPPKANPNAPANTASADPQGASTGDPSGSGAGFSKTNPPSTPTPPPLTPAADPTVPTIARNPASPSNGNPSPAGGVGSADPSAAHPAAIGNTGRASASPASAPPAAPPPWQSNAWQTDVKLARQELDSGAIAPSYRELVRQYFDASAAK